MVIKAPLAVMGVFLAFWRMVLDLFGLGGGSVVEEAATSASFAYSV